jgi:hypothetical protein
LRDRLAAGNVGGVAGNVLVQDAGLKVCEKEVEAGSQSGHLWGAANSYRIPLTASTPNSHPKWVYSGKLFVSERTNKRLIIPTHIRGSPRSASPESPFFEPDSSELPFFAPDLY